MKNFINYYYNMNVASIHQKGKNYYFNYKNDFYAFIIFTENILLKDIYELNMYLVNNNIPIHQIILNQNNEILSKINDNVYILLKITDKKKDTDINNLLRINNVTIPFFKIQNDSWNKLWSDKLDYFEYQISQIGKKYPILRESFNYYLGLGELAIAIVNNTEKNGVYYSLSHRRIEDIYNPLSLIIDIRVRDISEYFKYKFFDNQNINNELDLFLLNNNLTNNEKNLFLARMLFPTYYFDLYEKIIKGDISEENIKKIIAKVNDYEKILHKIYIYFNNNLQIDWLEKINLY